MSPRNVLLFLHGVGDKGEEEAWASGGELRQTLNETLAALGYPGLDGAAVVCAPDYSRTLYNHDEGEPIPPVTVEELRGEDAAQNRAAVAQRTAELEVLVGPQETGTGLPGAREIIAFFVQFQRQVRNYTNVPAVRANVLNQVIHAIPRPCRVVIIGHSFGSVVSADLIRRLPADVEVAGVVTLGSPLAHHAFDIHNLRTELSEPPPNVATWVNFWNDSDVRTTFQGISGAFDWVLDRRLRLGLLDHSHHGHLRAPQVGTAIGHALLGRLPETPGTANDEPRHDE